VLADVQFLLVVSLNPEDVCLCLVGLDSVNPLLRSALHLDRRTYLATRSASTKPMFSTKGLRLACLWGS